MEPLTTPYLYIHKPRRYQKRCRRLWTLQSFNKQLRPHNFHSKCGTFPILSKTWFLQLCRDFLKLAPALGWHFYFALTVQTRITKAGLYDDDPETCSAFICHQLSSNRPWKPLFTRILPQLCEITAIGGWLCRLKMCIFQTKGPEHANVLNIERRASGLKMQKVSSKSVSMWFFQPAEWLKFAISNLHFLQICIFQIKPRNSLIFSRWGTWD